LLQIFYSIRERLTSRGRPTMPLHPPLITHARTSDREDGTSGV
jgi:hypothetical protein